MKQVETGFISNSSLPQQRWLHIIPVTFAMYAIAFVDRANISLALPSMRAELHMDAAQAGQAAGVFFWTYMVFQVLGGRIASRWSAKGLITVSLILWGISAAACGWIGNWKQLWVMRLLLGSAEGGVFPATALMLSRWFPRAERARANGMWLLCQPVAIAVSSPVSGWLVDRWGWRSMLIAEGILPFILLPAWWWFIDDLPHQARWISWPERKYLESTYRSESLECDQQRKVSYLSVVRRPQVALLIFIALLLNSGSYGYLIWLPSTLDGVRDVTHLPIGILFTFPFIFACATMILNSHDSDRAGERRGHVALPLALAGVLLLVGVLTGNHSPVLAFTLVCLAGAGPYVALGPFWSIPTEDLPRNVAGVAIGLVAGLGNLGGFLGPVIVGSLNKLSGNFVYGFWFLGMALLAASALSFLLPRTARGNQEGTCRTPAPASEP